MTKVLILPIASVIHCVADTLFNRISYGEFGKSKDEPKTLTISFFSVPDWVGESMVTGLAFVLAWLPTMTVFSPLMLSLAISETCMV